MSAAELRFDAIGVPWRIDTADPLPAGLVRQLRHRIDDFDATWSRFRQDSLVSRVAERTGVWQFPPDAAPLFALYRRLYDATGGAVTPLVGRRLETLGLDRDYSLRPATHLAPVPRWDDVLSWDGTTLTTSQPVVLDVGAAGKGYLVDLVAGLLREAGIEEYLVDASGDLLHRGETPIRVALEHPTDPTLAIGVVELANGALCASAPGRRTWGTGLHHILDGLSGEPTTAVAATWAMADSALVADGLATTLFFTDGDTLEAALAAQPDPDAELQFQYVRMFPDGRAVRSHAFPGELFT